MLKPRAYAAIVIRLVIVIIVVSIELFNGAPPAAQCYRLCHYLSRLSSGSGISSPADEIGLEAEGALLEELEQGAEAGRARRGDGDQDLLARKDAR